MKTLTKNDNSLEKALRANGIAPHVFSLFLKSFVEKEKKKNRQAGTIEYHLLQVVEAQAELVQYHLRDKY